MKIIPLTLFALALSLAAGFAQDNQKPQITVSGTADVRVVPDEVVIHVGVETRNEKLDQARHQHDDLMKSALGFLKHTSVPDKDVQTDFINNVTHEFSTPLAVIELSTDGLERSAEQRDPSRTSKYIEMIRHQAQYLKKHIEGLMKTVVAEHHTASLEKTPVVINSLVRRAVNELAPLTSEKHGSMILQLEENDIKIDAEPDHLYLAIFNIINNALKYAVNPRIVITTYSRNNDYHIRVRDNGFGIDRKEFNNIFRKFYRVQNGNLHQAKGLGLGLYFTKKVVTLHQGVIKIQSTPGEGTTFTVVLPIA